MSQHVRVKLDNVGVFYHLLREPIDMSRGYLKGYSKFFKNIFTNRRDSYFWALENIDLSVCDGDTVGVIGKNGAGKSTLMRVIAGIIKPDKGSIRTFGRVSSLLSLNTGQQKNLTGRENIYLTGMLMGLKRKEIDSMLGEIIEFSELGIFIDQPVKNYSSGMRSRLGFSTVVNIDTEILLLDEIFSVGDASFRSKAIAKMEDFIGRAKTIFIVSHSLGFVKETCNKALWIDKGSVKEFGLVDEVVANYSEYTKQNKKANV